VPAGLIMMMVQTAIHAVLTSHASSSPAVILQKTNQVIRENIKKLGEDKYMTITLFYYKGDGRFYFSGLHQDIMIYRSQTKHVEIIETQGVWLGIMDNIEDLNQVMEFTLNSGDTMLLYTDGITEAQDKTGRLYSDEKLLSFLTDYGDRSPQHIKELLLKSLNEYSCPDDITFMVIERI
jgi:serine phosphatase RsbU (regulator of sigma subunit)